MATTKTQTKEVQAPATDKFGFTKGTKTAQAAALYARKNGATMGEIKKALGGPMRNMLAVAEKRGHTVERIERKCAVTGKEAIAFKLA